MRRGADAKPPKAKIEDDNRSRGKKKSKVKADSSKSADSSCECQECVKSVKHKKVKIDEKGRSATFVNETKKLFLVVEVDGCLVTGNRIPRCDYLVSLPDVASVFVELKGRNVEHATEQLFASIDNPDVKKFATGKLAFLVMCKRYPRFDTFVRRAKHAAMRDFRAKLHVICDQRELEIESLT